MRAPERGGGGRKKKGGERCQPEKKKRGRARGKTQELASSRLSPQLDFNSFFCPFAPPPLQPCSLPSPPRCPRGKQHAVPRLSRVATARAPVHARARKEREGSLDLAKEVIGKRARERALEIKSSLVLSLSLIFPPPRTQRLPPASSPQGRSSKISSRSSRACALSPRARARDRRKSAPWCLVVTRSRRHEDDGDRPTESSEAHVRVPLSLKRPKSPPALSPRAAAPWSSSPTPRRRTSRSRASTRSR